MGVSVSDLTIKSMIDGMDDALSNARRVGFKMGLVFASLPVIGGLVFMCAAQVYLSERREAQVRTANIEAAACHIELEQHRTNDDLWRACIGGAHAMQNELANLVRGCAQ